MAFLTEQELESLRIDQSVFHIVGPGEEHFQLLTAFDAGRHAPFSWAASARLTAETDTNFWKTPQSGHNLRASAGTKRPSRRKAKSSLLPSITPMEVARLWGLS